MLLRVLVLSIQMSGRLQVHQQIVWLRWSYVQVVPVCLPL